MCLPAAASTASVRGVPPGHCGQQPGFSEQPPAQPALQQQVEAITGVTRPEEVAPEMLTSEEANRQRLLMLQQKADEEAKALATALPELVMGASERN